MAESNIKRIFKEKEDTLFKDIFGGASFTVKELNEAFLKPTILMHPDNPESIEMRDLEQWLERFEKA